MLLADHDVDSLVRSGRFSEALQSLLRSRPEAPSVRETLLHAELLQLTGDNRAAGHLLAHIERAVANEPVHLAKHEEIRGVMAADAGEVGEAVSRFQRALEAATSAGDLASTCRIQLRLLPNLAETSGGSGVESLANTARGNVLRLGDPQTLALLHLRFAQLEARRGAVDQATRHLKLGWSALEEQPNLWIAALLSLDTSAIKWIAGDYEQAENHAHRALALARRSGHSRTEAGALANLCDFAAQRGHIDRARHLVADGTRLASGYPRVRMAILETAAQLELDARNYEVCANLLDEVDRWCDLRGDQRSWLYLSLLRTRIRLLQRTGRMEDAAGSVNRAIQLADEKGNAFWRCVFRVMRAELLLDAQDLAGARVSLRDARQLGGAVPMSVTAVIERVHGQLLAASGLRSAGVSVLGFASRLSAESGTSGSTADLADAAAHALGLDFGDVRGDEPGQLVAKVQAGLRDLEDALAPETVIALERLLVVAAKPASLAQEVRAILLRLGVVSNVRILRESTSSRRSQAHSAREDGVLRLTIPCGTEDGQSLVVEALSKDTVLAESSTSAVARFAAAIVAVETSRKEALERGSLWPIEPEDDHDGASESPVMRRLMLLARRLADSDIPVLLTGETGVGKEVFAREIHQHSGFSAGPFVPFNCATVPRDMLEAQLFGHKKGAFTGASEGFQGVIRSADGGTLFLDEIGEMALDVQPKLLRFLDSHEVHPLGEAHPLKVNVRVIAATNADLEGMVSEGRFRGDLLFRLNVMPIRIPPLRDRREEVPSLVYHYVERFCREQRKPTMKVSDEAMEHLTLHSWPGNIRQLSNELRRVVALADPGATLTPAMLSSDIRAGRKMADTPGPPLQNDELPVSLDQPLEAAVEAIERAMIDRALKASDGNLERAAERLGISRKGLFLKRKRLGLRPS